jgi:hypothetical protein
LRCINDDNEKETFLDQYPVYADAEAPSDAAVCLVPEKLYRRGPHILY